MEDGQLFLQNCSVLAAPHVTRQILGQALLSSRLAAHHLDVEFSRLFEVDWLDLG